MLSFLASFLVSAVLTLLVIRVSKHHGAALDSNLFGVQKVHIEAVPRIGGLAIFVAVCLDAVLICWRVPAIASAVVLLLACSSIGLMGGLAEDFTGRVSPMSRLVIIMIAALSACFLIDARITHIDFIFYDWRLVSLWVAIPLTVLAVTCIVNAINLIDGFNGLASVVSIIMLLSLAYVALQVNDMLILTAALAVAGAAAGFLIWNYPGGLIFLGDGGAYFLGFMLAELTVLLVARNPQVSPWYAALLLVYPGFETMFSAYRRAFLRGRSPGMPDGIHLHSLIFRRLVLWAVGDKDGAALTQRNALTSPYLWLLSLMAVIPATLLWRHTGWLMLFCLLFVVSYVWLYNRIVRFKSPRWMILTDKRTKED